ncbi:MAG: tetratricopeptide repeat protein [Anaerolineae bacterium]
MPPTRSTPATRPRWLRLIQARLYFLRGSFHRHFGNLSGERREYQWAVDRFSNAIELDPSFVAAYYGRGVLYWRELENWYRAIHDLTRVIELAPHWHEAWLNRAIAQHRRGDFEAAISDLEHYLTVAKDPGWRANAESQLGMMRAVLAEKQHKREA